MPPPKKTKPLPPVAYNPDSAEDPQNRRVIDLVNRLVPDSINHYMEAHWTTWWNQQVNDKLKTERTITTEEIHEELRLWAQEHPLARLTWLQILIILLAGVGLLFFTLNIYHRLRASTPKPILASVSDNKGSTWSAHSAIPDPPTQASGSLTSTTASSDAGPLSSAATTGSVVMEAAPAHYLELTLAQPCWTRVTNETTGRVLFEGTPKVNFIEINQPQPWFAEVRSGCPGQVLYNGKPPAENLSKTPKKSEVVELEL